MKKFALLFLILTSLCASSCKKSNCNDGIQNGEETDIDCGGDCRVCFTCEDGFKNQGETDVDCGGPCPNRCANEWVQLPVLQELQGQTAPILSFVDENYGFLGARENLFKTTNGGNNWTKVTLPNATFNHLFQVIYFLNKNIGFINGIQYRSPPVIESAYFLRTENGGSTWEQVLLPTNFQKANVSQITFVNAQTAIAALHFGAGDSYMLQSNDGGKSWTQKFFLGDLRNPDGIPFDAELIVRNIVIRNDGNLFATAQGGMIRSNDNGNTWQYVLTGPGTQLSGGLRFLNAQSGILLRGRTRYQEPAAYETLDGGVTWQQLNVPRNPLEKQLAAYIVSPQEWRALYEFKNPYPDFYNFSFAGRTLDAGKTWSNYGIASLSFTTPVEHCIFVNAQTCYCAGRNGYLIKLKGPN